ncbi:hypothetical protein AG0111_0g7945 [Alternaria gaisen]|uniref:Uncharacterized protein n=1 Tax=Alternaria gaisen TaxID=167740 RepID=A0ACB6FHI8_9PLEO|nr:hypothetical protein AG0111_0g7945 [Alternaria gaisen]
MSRTALLYGTLMASPVLHRAALRPPRSHSRAPAPPNRGFPLPRRHPLYGEASINDVDDAVAALNDPTSGRGVNGDIPRQLESGGQAEEKVLGGAV